MEEKTNVMRILDQKKIPYTAHSYVGTDALSGVEVASVLKQNPDQVFKTLVTKGKSGKYFVFMVPVAKELNLKKAAAAVREKSVEMIHQKDLLPLTGYVHGGCSPIGLKKPFPVTIDRTVEQFETILYSAGKIGYQVQTSLASLGKVVRLQTADIAD